jgi:hypothetical protein
MGPAGDISRSHVFIFVLAPFATRLGPALTFEFLSRRRTAMRALQCPSRQIRVTCGLAASHKASVGDCIPAELN